MDNNSNRYPQHLEEQYKEEIAKSLSYLPPEVQFQYKRTQVQLSEIQNIDDLRYITSKFFDAVFFNQQTMYKAIQDMQFLIWQNNKLRKYRLFFYVALAVIVALSIVSVL